MRPRHGALMSTGDCYERYASHHNDPDYPRAHGFEVADYVQPADVGARLDEGWKVEVDRNPAVRRPGAGGLAVHA